MANRKPARLILEDGTIFHGTCFGAEQSSSGEVVFNTGMVGYPETLTDPSYAGQILVMTYPLVGNYGVPPQEQDEHGVETNFESDQIHVRALIVSEYCEVHSHWKSNISLSEWLKKENIPAIYGIDTRALTKKLREQGVMCGKIIVDDNDVELFNPDPHNMVAEVSCSEIKTYGSGKHKIVAVDLGMKNNIIRSLLEHDVTVTVVPWDYDFTTLEYDGLFLSNGPGNPVHCTTTIENIKKALAKDTPLFGICLGNQLLSLAAGATVSKLKYGHRSHNQPAHQKGSERCYITSQNHGYTVNTETLSDEWELWFSNSNDDTNEGIRHVTKPFFSVQFHPEAKAGPQDTAHLFTTFIEAIENAQR